MSRADEGGIVIPESNAGALGVYPVFGSCIAKNGGLSFSNDLVANSADVSGRTRVSLYVSP